MLKNDLTKRLKIGYPIIQAPMAGGITKPALVAAVSNAGGLGMIGAGYLTAAQTKEQIREIKQLTGKPFGINLFVPGEFEVDEKVTAANGILNRVRKQLKIEAKAEIEVPDLHSVQDQFLAQVQVAIEEKVPVCSFTFGIPSREVIEKLKQNGILLIGTATTVDEAIEVEQAGMDMVVAQGSEAGGHRGNFLKEHEESMIGLMSLIPQVADNVRIPVIAAGGIMDGRGLAAALCLGAKGVQMGTAFLACAESGAPQSHKEAVLHAKEDELVLTRSFSGKWARGVKNAFISEMKPHEALFPDYPVQNTLTQDIRKAAGKQNNREFMSLWAGQSPRLAKHQTAKALIDHVIKEAEEIMGKMPETL
ncbi:NAD(P)H-dependent flavin oxidoreductase [Heyndrickxia coagulans]|uniref:Probable nitronate monooxygenase n=1 Tax=Heyndrickxia coagulans TaxID=1398 RepID=A0A133KFY2_HEYCO|nr:nitronate monooxygenase [Heyndrickxia coagulans]KWZ78473.1 oxidoreductase, 2-nitropropane dioxygenase family protein [Heyndrickxia coagulans]